MRVEFQVKESGGGGGALVRTLLRARDYIEQGWIRNVQEYLLPNGRIVYCVHGALQKAHFQSGGSSLTYMDLVSALKAGLPSDVRWPTEYHTPNLPPDDAGTTYGESRGTDHPGSALATYNNAVARTKQDVLDVFDRAIALEKEKVAA